MPNQIHLLAQQKQLKHLYLVSHPDQCMHINLKHIFWISACNMTFCKFFCLFFQHIFLTSFPAQHWHSLRHFSWHSGWHILWHIARHSRTSSFPFFVAYSCILFDICFDILADIFLPFFLTTLREFFLTCLLKLFLTCFDVFFWVGEFSPRAILVSSVGVVGFLWLCCCLVSRCLGVSLHVRASIYFPMWKIIDESVLLKGSLEEKLPRYQLSNISTKRHFGKVTFHETNRSVK